MWILECILKEMSQYNYNMLEKKITIKIDVSLNVDVA
jgi:hypothetical protein